MMSEPLRQPPPPHTMGVGGKGSVKRKLDPNPDGSAGEEDRSGAKRRKEEGTSKKKSRTANGIPKGFQIKPLTGPSSTVSKDRSASGSGQPSTSTAKAPFPSPPSNRHAQGPVNPEDRPLPRPASFSLAYPVEANQPKPSTSSRHPLTKSTVHRSNGTHPSSTSKGKERARDDDSAVNGTPEELERLEQLHGEIDLLEGGRQKEGRRRAGTSPKTTKQNSTSRSAAKPISAAKSLETLRTPNAYPTPSKSFQASSNSNSANSSGESFESRHGLHASTSTIPVPMDSTPMIKKNRELRKEQTVRRKSSLGLRSVRVSESFGAGILANPHPSVESPNFYTHISPELPEALRIRQLLVWCSSRAQITTGSPAPSPSLPALSSAQETSLREIQDELMKSLCLGKVDTSLPTGSGTPGKRKPKLKEHPRNAVNRVQEVTNIKQSEAAKAEDAVWSETIQGLNRRQANVFESIQKRSERRRALEEEFQVRWDEERRKRKGKEKATPDSMELDLEDDAEEELEARILSSMWDVPTDVYRGTERAAFAESVRLVEEERRVKVRKGGLDEREEALEQRMQAMEILVDELHRGAHTAVVLVKHTDSHLKSFTQSLASRFNSRIPTPPSGTLPVPPTTAGGNGSSSSPTTASALLTAMQPAAVLSTSAIPDPMAKLSILSTAKLANESDAARQAALELEMGVAERRITAIPATPNTRRTPRKSVGKKG